LTVLDENLDWATICALFKHGFESLQKEAIWLTEKRQRTGLRRDKTDADWFSCCKCGPINKGWRSDREGGNL
jgi:hypothetical protein